MVDMNKAYVKSKFAEFVDPDMRPPNEVMPIYTAPGYFNSRVLTTPSLLQTTKNETEETSFYDDSLIVGVRRMKINEELDKFLNF